jgi:hypothetical protein
MNAPLGVFLFPPGERSAFGLNVGLHFSEHGGNKNTKLRRRRSGIYLVEASPKRDGAQRNPLNKSVERNGNRHAE